MLRPKHFEDNMFKYSFLKENLVMITEILLMFIPEDQIDNSSA